METENDVSYSATNVRLTLKRGKRNKKLKLAIYYVVLSVLALFFMFPFFYMFFMSFMTPLESIGFPKFSFLPTVWTIENYLTVFDEMYIRALINTLIIIGANMILIPAGCTVCAYGFARMEFPGKELLFGITLSTIMLPSIVVQIPLYVQFFSWGWTDTLYPFIVPSILGGGAANIFLCRQFIRTIPKAMDEAARIDGASSFRIYLTIILPLMMPVVVFVMVGVFNGFWNDFTTPLMYLRKPEMYTLPLAIYHKYAGQLQLNLNPPSKQMAIGVFTIIPAAIVFFVFQKQIIDGVVMSGIKE